MTRFSQSNDFVSYNFIYTFCDQQISRNSTLFAYYSNVYFFFIVVTFIGILFLLLPTIVFGVFVGLGSFTFLFK